jgi:hypothetical protein
VTIPASSFQLAFYLALLVPGVVFAAARVRLRGPRAPDRSVGSRILEAIVASAILDAIYALILSGQVAEAVEDVHAYLAANVASAALAFLICGAAIPYLAAWLIYGKVPWLAWIGRLGDRLRPGLTASQEDADTPTAWDYGTRNTRPGWVRIRLAEGVWVGGVWDDACRYSTYPEARDIFIAQEWSVDAAGAFGEPVENSQGVWLAVKDEYVLEWVRDEKEAGHVG